MSTTSAVSSSNIYQSLGLGNSNSSASSSSADANLAISEQQFLKLMTTQLQTQDPLHPVTNAEFFSQLAQFSTVSGINQLNSTVSSLTQQMTTNQYLQGASLVGHGVLMKGSSSQLTSAGLIGGVEVPSSGDVTVQIKNAGGTVVATLDLGTQPAGTVPFSWNGKDANGTAQPTGSYTLSATVSTGSGTVAAQTDVGALVDSVSVDSTNGLMLNLDGIGPTAFSKVIQII